jgi:hypothetical protein
MARWIAEASAANVDPSNRDESNDKRNERPFRAVKLISHSIRNDDYRADSGPSRGYLRRRAFRPERSSDFRARTIASDVVRKSALASSVGTLRFQLAYCSNRVGGESRCQYDVRSQQRSLQR